MPACDVQMFELNGCFAQSTHKKPFYCALLILHPPEFWASSADSGQCGFGFKFPVSTYLF
jgi:hypothetical protein